MRRRVTRLVLATGSTILLALSHQAMGWGQSESVPFDESKVAVNGRLNLVYKAIRKDKSPQEFRDVQIEMNKKHVEERLKKGELDADSAEKIMDAVNIGFKHQADYVYRSMILFSPKGFLYSAVDGKLRSEVVIADGKTLARDDSVIYRNPGVNTDRLTGMPPLAVNFDSLKLVRPNSDGKMPNSVLYLNPGSSSGAARGSYQEGNVVWEMKEGLPLVRRIYVGDASRPIEDILYSDHRKVGNVFLPAKITLRQNSGTPKKPDVLVPVSETVYTLVSASDKVSDEAIVKSATLKTGDFLQNDDGSTAQSFTYDATKSIEEQHAAAFRDEQKTEEDAKRYKYARQTNGGIILTLSGAGILLFWLARRLNSGRHVAKKA